ncbi:uncharacterized protein MELLADRAFT_67229 [Melampsora larici-populina 98AG31]|uniref:Uncharacterized protein n=1 Tax=Melampsora larici-populina (strain 98AG31 / pathotype 3-4-7) TaxID=747676 RepID=F4S2A1_MELLP|nr:uncharacterized protein MELLADRAFT_67229 [Melampsora larici-populina 98AG31]EGG01239.1 hypothetical protein MELLADRAFT_67229 [Melampsora larici-populina 98AG31]
MLLFLFTQSSISSLLILISWAISIIQLNALPFNEAGEILVTGIPDDAAVLRQIQARIGTVPEVEEDKYTFFKKSYPPPKPTSDSNGLWRKLSIIIRPSVGVDRHAPIHQIASNWKDLDINSNLKPLVNVILLCGSNAKQFASRVERSSTSISPTGKILLQKAISVLNVADLTQSERVWVHGLIDSLQLYCPSRLDLSAASSATPSLLRGELEHLRVSGAALRDWIVRLSKNPSSEAPPTAKGFLHDQNQSGEILESLERVQLLKGIKEKINQGSVKHDPESIRRLYDDILADTIARPREELILDKVRPTAIKHLASPVTGWTKEISVWVLSHFMKHYKDFKSHMETVIGKDRNLLSNYMDIKLRDIMDQLESSGLKEESEWMDLARTFKLWDSDPDFRRDVIQTWSHLYDELDQKKVPYLSWEHKKLGSLDQKSLLEMGTIELEKSWGDTQGLQVLKKQLSDLSSGDIQAKENLFYTTTQYLSQGILERDLSKPGPRDNLIAKPLERFYVEALAYLVSGERSFKQKLRDLMAKQSGLKHRLINQMKKEVGYDFLPEAFRNKKLLPFHRWLTQASEELFF